MYIQTDLGIYSDRISVSWQPQCSNSLEEAALGIALFIERAICWVPRTFNRLILMSERWSERIVPSQTYSTFQRFYYSQLL